MNKVLGICGCGSNILRHIMKKEMNSLELISIQEDPLVLDVSEAHKKILINSELDKELDKVLINTSKVFVIFGLGGTTGSHYSKFIIKTITEKGIDVRVFCMYPFNWEGEKRKRIADDTLELIQNLITDIEVFKNEDLLKLINENESVNDAFELFDEKIYKSILEKV